MNWLKQTPPPGDISLYYQGDIIEVNLSVDGDNCGEAYLYTNLGNADVQRHDLIKSLEDRCEPQGQDWQSLPMEKIDEHHYKLRIPLIETGHFEAKTLFHCHKTNTTHWPDGDNISINIEPAAYSGMNSIYCAFPRQFGPNKTAKSSVSAPEMEKLDQQNYTVIPPSGTFRDLMQELDHIIYGLKCRIIHLLPINPTPTTYGRMGRYGSPYAALDFTAIDPALCEFDRSATPLEQFTELVNEIHIRSGKLFIDLAINHTGWAAKIHEEHPEWLLRGIDGEIQSPGAWGTIWADLTELDYNHLELCQYLSEVFITWCKRGVDGFRCDAGYMIPETTWQYIIGLVRNQYPETIFLLEGLGGDLKITESILNTGGMDWAYSELFQNYSKDEITNYLGYANHISQASGILINYAETHDNSRLAANSKCYAKMRVALNALLSTNGGFGITNGVEWFATEKIDVHEASGLNWGATENMVAFICQLNTILALHPAFGVNSPQRFIDSDNPNILIHLRGEGKEQLRSIINLSDKTIDIYPGCSGIDLFSGREISDQHHQLSSYEVLAISEQRWSTTIAEAGSKKELPLARVWQQKQQAMALTAWSSCRTDLPEDCSTMGQRLNQDPEAFCQEIFDHNLWQPWQIWDSAIDLKRDYMLFPKHLVLFKSSNQFILKITLKSRVLKQQQSIKSEKGYWYVLLPALTAVEESRWLDIKLDILTVHNATRRRARLLQLAENYPDKKNHLKPLSHQEIIHGRRTYLGTNGLGGMCHIPISWGKIYSKYDALLAANLHDAVPVNRQILWTQQRIWVTNLGRSVELTEKLLTNFKIAKDGSGVWNFEVPIGCGKIVKMVLRLSLTPGKNSLKLRLKRLASDDDDIVKVIMRPDIEDRDFHRDTKAYSGPEENWPKAIVRETDGFTFSSTDTHQLKMTINSGEFFQESEWRYNTFHEVEAERNIEANSDLFSPGYFISELPASSELIITAEAKLLKSKVAKKERIAKLDFSTQQATYQSLMQQFVVKRDDLKSVIAGYPWFLDWGRDTLICARGLLAAENGTDLDGAVARIFLNFARFAEDGTLPNIIHGETVGNRDTSDAQLWLYVGLADFCKRRGDFSILQQQVSDKKDLQMVLIELATAIINGTKNGIKMEPKTGLVFSPSHFTWMDTNYPAGTPRSGYPIEIQALWFATCNFLFEVTQDQQWQNIAQRVTKYVKQLFVTDEGWLADCLHSSHALYGAENATADDALRCNQLFAITLGLVEDDKDLCRNIIHACQELLVPGGIRSLADRPVKFELPIYSGDGLLLNNPSQPYQGEYIGDEDSRRKVAYHNGTVWSWPFPSFAEALLMTYGEEARTTAEAILSSSELVMRDGCFAHIPEISDGNAPHTQRGCDAQAWGITEFYRIWEILKSINVENIDENSK